MKDLLGKWLPTEGPGGEWYFRLLAGSDQIALAPRIEIADLPLP